MKSKIDKTDAPKGYYAARAKVRLSCDECELQEAASCHTRRCMAHERKDGRDVIFRKLKKGGTP
jgi:hypothetical protein